MADVVHNFKSSPLQVQCTLLCVMPGIEHVRSRDGTRDGRQAFRMEVRRTPDQASSRCQAENVRFNGKVWSEGVSHGEMIRDGFDQTLSIDPCQPLKFLYQGAALDKAKKYEYIEVPYRLGLITATAPNAVSALCKK